VRDPRGGGRSSARLTAPVVGAGAIAKKWLREQYGTEFMGCMSQLGDIAVPFQDWDTRARNPFFAATGDAA
jgi:chorismate synthase